MPLGPCPFPAERHQTRLSILDFPTAELLHASVGNIGAPVLMDGNTPPRRCSQDLPDPLNRLRRAYNKESRSCVIEQRTAPICKYLQGLPDPLYDLRRA